MSQPLVTVGIPTYNRPDSLAECLRKIIKQTYTHLDIFISDNHSPNPDVAKVLEEFAQKDTRIRYVIQEHNIEAEPNFNFVYANARGDYFIWLSDDDSFQDDYIERCVEYLLQHPEYVSCAGVSTYFSKGVEVSREKRFAIENKSRLARFFNYFYHVSKNGIFYGVFQRKFLSENPIGKFVGSDWNVVAHLALQGKIQVLQDVCMYRSLDGGSATRSSMIKRWKLSKFQTLFFETYACYKVCEHIFYDPKGAAHFNYATQKIIQGILFIFLNVKFLLNSIRIRLK
ncbi:MAG TPA: glycosyltransferase family 2 protein [Chitinophagaceae bacterium]|nr:glycosyltransferase family 2 protein [Chitinophagaceae bacterium]